VWLADDSLLTPVYDRVRHLLPQELDGGALAGEGQSVTGHRQVSDRSFHHQDPQQDPLQPDGCCGCPAP
jgi:hypothetical protein